MGPKEDTHLDALVSCTSPKDSISPEVLVSGLPCRVLALPSLEEFFPY